MKTVRRPCSNSYQHYFVRTSHDCVELDLNTWDRTLELQCSRCGYVLWVDSVIRLFDKLPEVWKGT